MTTWNITASYSFDMQRDVTSLATWQTNDASILTVSNGTGTVATAGHIYGGDVYVTASIDGLSCIASANIIASDSSSYNILMPQKDAHWSLIGLSPWSSYGGLQEQTGNVILSGTDNYALTGSAGGGVGVLYGVQKQDWIRNFISLSGTSGQNVSSRSGSGPNPNATSVAWLTYAQVGKSANSNMICGYLGASTNMVFRTVGSSAGVVGISYNGLSDRTLVGPYDTDLSSRVRPYLVVYNKTSGELWGYTDSCLAMTSSIAGIAGVGQSGIGAAAGRTCASASYCYFATCTGSLAEYYSNPTNAGNLLSSFGWNVNWKNCPTDSGTIKLPFLPSHWSELGYQPWAAVFNCQEQSSVLRSFNMWDGVLQEGWTTSAPASVTYAVSVDGWTRKGITFTETANNYARISNTVFSTPSSAAYLAYVKFNSTSANARGVLGQSGVNGATMQCIVNQDGIPGINCFGVLSSGTIDHRDDRVHPVLVVYDITSARAKLYTDLSKHTGTYGNLTVAPQRQIGGGTTNNNVSAPNTFLYWAMCSGTVASSLSDDGVASKFLKDLGWNVDW